MKKIGLFPLSIVLFPDSAYPLHIFEERYKELMKDCIENEDEFGINFMTSSKMAEVGCTARISDIMKKYPDGKLDILVVGVKRFRVKHFTEGEKPYYLAEIEYFDDDDLAVDKLMLINCLDLFNTIADKIRTIKIDKININKLETEQPSFQIAQKAGMTAEQKQILLEMRSENTRLGYLSNHLRKLLPIVNEAESITKIIKNDGYIKPNLYKQ